MKKQMIWGLHNPPATTRYRRCVLAHGQGHREDTENDFRAANKRFAGARCQTTTC